MSIWNYLFKAKAAKRDTAVEAGALGVTRRDAGRINKNYPSFHLAGKILKWQRQVATYLNTKTNDISKPKIRLSLICFIALAACTVCT